MKGERHLLLVMVVEFVGCLEGAGFVAGGIPILEIREITSVELRRKWGNLIIPREPVMNKTMSCYACIQYVTTKVMKLKVTAR